MPYIPHTPAEIQEMLATLGMASTEALFAEIPLALRSPPLNGLPPGMNEAEISRLMHSRARQDSGGICFIGAGAYEHHIPAAVWELASRGEFYSAYTPYQAEASQGTLQVMYEFQSMMATLTGMDVSNASLYDGASALAEAILMALRLARNAPRRVLVPRTLPPRYRDVARTLVKNQGIELVEVAFDPHSGQTLPSHFDQALAQAGGAAALVIPQPNFFGVIEEVDACVAWAAAQQPALMTIAVANPLALAILAPPGEWGGQGVDIACGEAQPLGIPLSSGGPYLGYLCCKNEHIRQLPGRIAGRTTDVEGNPGFTLTLQAREQHIRRAKATSNICTNQGLMMIASTIYMALQGAEGLAQTAWACHHNTLALRQKLTAIPGVATVFDAPVFHEAVLRLPVDAREALRILAAHNILGGYALQDDYPELGNAVLVCATEQRTDEEMEQYAAHLRRVLHQNSASSCKMPPASIFST